MARISEETLLETLGIDRNSLEELLSRGLPHALEGGIRRYSPEVVRDWLVEGGLAHQARIVPTQGQIADYFGVSTRTVREWVRQGCPGEAGCWDLDAIERWRDGQQERGTTANAARTRKLLAEAEAKELELGERKNLLLDAEKHARLTLRRISEAKAILDQLPDMVQALCAQVVPVGEIRKRVEEAVDNAYKAIRDIVNDDEDAVEQEEEN